MRRLLFSTLCVLVFQTGCSQERSWKAVNQMIESHYPEVPSITTEELATRLSDSTTTRPVLLDARAAEEYAVSHLPSAHRIAPTAKTFPRLDSLSGDTPIVVYCSVGYRSARIAHRLQKQGFTNVVNLKGSIFQWANEGRSVYREGQPVAAVHPYDPTWGQLLADSLHAYHPEAN